MEEFIGKLIACVIIFVPMGLLLWHQIYNERQRKNKDIAGNIDHCISLEEDTRTLVVRQLHPLIWRVVTMDRYEILHTKYQPETYTFTSVTVGNVTTGGVTKEEAYKYISGSSKTDKYQLLYLGKAIRKIKLCGDDLIRKAKQAGLDKYMNRAGEIVVVGRTSVSQDALESALSGYYAQMQLQQLEGQPDYGKCRSILAFLTSTKGQPVPKVEKTPEQKKAIKFTVVALLFVVLVFGGFLGMSYYQNVKQDMKVVLSDLRNNGMTLTDPAALGLEGDEGFCSITKSGNLYINTWSETDGEYLHMYEYTIHPKMMLGNNLYFDLTISKNSSHGGSTPPESITRLTLTFREGSHREYTDLKLLDSSGNVVASSNR